MCLSEGTTCATPVAAPDARRLASLRPGSLREVYDLFAGQPPLTLRAAARRLGMSAPSVYRAKRRLEREGLLSAPGPVQVASR